MGKRSMDGIDRLVVFLAKRDGIDKLVKTFQYVSKLSHWHLQRRDPKLAVRIKKLELACGLARKAFRSGRFLTGFNALRTTKYSGWGILTLAILANAGEMVYFFFDHVTWISRVGLIDAEYAKTSAFISAAGEGFGYIFAMWSDLIFISRGQRREQAIEAKLEALMEEDDDDSVLTITRPSSRLSPQKAIAVGRGREVHFLDQAGAGAGVGAGGSRPSTSQKEKGGGVRRRGGGGEKPVGVGTWKVVNGNGRKHEEELPPALSMEQVRHQATLARDEEILKLRRELTAIRMDRVMRLMALAANFADLLIAVNEVEPNPFVSHAVTLGISGLVSAWGGWYRNWPAKE